MSTNSKSKSKNNNSYVFEPESFSYKVLDKEKDDRGNFGLLLEYKSTSGKRREVKFRVPYSFWKKVSKGDRVVRKTVYGFPDKHDEKNGGIDD